MSFGQIEKRMAESSNTVIRFHKDPDTFTEYAAKIWTYRSLIVTFAKRDLKVKYSQTFLGVLWILLAPFPSVIVFTFFFGKIIKLDTGLLPYPVFALTGLIGWSLFSNLNSSIGSSLIEAQGIIKKIYFPKMILPFSKILSAGVDFVVSFLVLLMVMIFMGVSPGWTIVFFPLFLLLNIICGCAIGIWIAALTFRYRDMQHFIYQILNFSIWLTPVFYPATILPASLHYLMYFNPMAFVIVGYRYTLSGAEMPSFSYMISIIPLLLILISGLFYFRKIEDEIAETV